MTGNMTPLIAHSAKVPASICIRSQRVICGVLMVLSFGCQSYLPKPLDPGATAAGFGNRTLDDPGLRAFLEAQHAGGAWSVDKLALAGAWFQGDVAVARARAEEAAAGISTAGERPNPVLCVRIG